MNVSDDDDSSGSDTSDTHMARGSGKPTRGGNSTASAEEAARIAAADVQEWDPTTLPKDGFSCVFFGARRTGKTFLIEEVIHKLHTEGGRSWDAVFLFSDTALVNRQQYKWISPIFKFEGVQEETVQSIFKRQEDMNLASKEGGPGEDHHVLIIADDVISDPRIRHSPVINKLYTAGRHYRIDVVILSQSIGGAAGLPPVVRMNADVVCIFRPRSTRDRELIAEWFLGIVDSDFGGTKLGRAFMKIVTQKDFTTMVVDLAKQNVSELTDYVFTYCAQPDGVPAFRLGPSKHWEGLGFGAEERTLGYRSNCL